MNRYIKPYALIVEVENEDVMTLSGETTTLSLDGGSANTGNIKNAGDDTEFDANSYRSNLWGD